MKCSWENSPVKAKHPVRKPRRIILGFQECNANFIAMVDDDDIQYMIIQEENSAYVAYTSLLSTQNTLILTDND